MSPELALVCPELGDQARAALPARPWELFLQPPVAGAQQFQQALDERPSGGIERGQGGLTPNDERVAIEAGTPTASGPRGRWALRAAPVVVIALALTAVTWASERTPAPTFGRYEGGVLPHSANYLFTGGSLRLDPDRRVTVRFTGGCAASGSTTSTPIVADQFRFRGDLVGLRRVHATVSGVFLDSRFARLKIDLVGRGCVVGEIERVASLT